MVSRKLSHWLMALMLHLTVCRLEAASSYKVDDTMGFGRTYDGIGGLSGGSATSKLLIAYPEKQRNEILDYLFKPNFAASLQILKVEIGGDAQSSDATEASHMHSSWEENYNRGYEWWLMKEAKKRNPGIKLYGLPWNFPGWLGGGTQNPYIDPQRLATYIMKWVRGARDVHNLTIDYIGIWNERNYDITYIKTLRSVLDAGGFGSVAIVASDNFGWDDICGQSNHDSELAAAVGVIGSHYPGTVCSTTALATGKQLWSSEDYSSYNNNQGGGCWARILNQNYVNGFMTSTIAWNLIDSFYMDLPWDRDSLMTAREPWSGSYIVESPIWVSAHTCQFTQTGWLYLQHGRGVGLLDKGGSYVSLTSPDTEDLTIVIETMSHDHSVCIRPALPAYDVSPQTAVFRLGGSFGNIGELQVWYTKLGFDNTSSIFMQKRGTIKPKDGAVTLELGVDEVWTLTSLTSGQKGEYPPPPPSQNFSLPFTEDFEAYSVAAEPYLLAQQQGAFEVVDSGDNHGKVMRQMVLQMPVVWCTETSYLNATMDILGQVNWTDIYIEADVRISPVNGTTGVFIAARIDQGGCETYKAQGVFFFLFPNDDLFLVTSDIQRSKILAGGREYAGIEKGWNSMSLLVENGQAIGMVNKKQLFNITLPASPPNGWVGVGTDSYGLADFDNIKVTTPSEGRDIMSRSGFKGESVSQGVPWSELKAAVRVQGRKGAAREDREGPKDKEDKVLYFAPHQP